MTDIPQSQPLSTCSSLLHCISWTGGLQAPSTSCPGPQSQRFVRVELPPELPKQTAAVCLSLYLGVTYPSVLTEEPVALNLCLGLGWQMSHKTSILDPCHSSFPWEWSPKRWHEKLHQVASETQCLSTMHYYQKDGTAAYCASKYISCNKHSAGESAKYTHSQSNNTSTFYKRLDKLKRVHLLHTLPISVSGLISALSD